MAHRVWPGIDTWIIDRIGIFQRVRVNRSEPFDDMKRFTGSRVQAAAVIRNDLRSKRNIREIDDKGATLPTAARISHPLPDLGAWMRTAVQRNDAIYGCISKNECDVTGRLNNLSHGAGKGSGSETVAYIHGVFHNIRPSRRSG